MSPTVIYVILGIIIVAVFGLAAYEYADKKKTINSFKQTLLDLEKLRLSNIDTMEASNCANIKDYEEKIYNLEELHKQEVQDIYTSHNAELEELRDLHVKTLEKVSKDYVETIEDQNGALDLYEKHLMNLDYTIQFTDKVIKELDIRGAYESDDELGIFFKAIKEMQDHLNNFKIEKEQQDEQK